MVTKSNYCFSLNNNEKMVVKKLTSSHLTFLIKLYQSWREKSNRWVGVELKDLSLNLVKIRILI